MNDWKSCILIPSGNFPLSVHYLKIMIIMTLFDFSLDIPLHANENNGTFGEVTGLSSKKKCVTT
jgi:hypothetical protein